MSQERLRFWIAEKLNQLGMITLERLGAGRAPKPLYMKAEKTPSPPRGAANGGRRSTKRLAGVLLLHPSVTRVGGFRSF